MVVNSPHAEFARRQCHWPECRRTETPCIDAHGPVKLIGGCTAGREPAECAAQRRHVGKADGEIQRDDALLPGRQRKTEREVGGRGVMAFEIEVRVDRAQGETERIWIGHLDPDANSGAAER